MRRPSSSGSSSGTGGCAGSSSTGAVSATTTALLDLKRLPATCASPTANKIDAAYPGFLGVSVGPNRLEDIASGRDVVDDFKNRNSPNLHFTHNKTVCNPLHDECEKTNDTIVSQKLCSIV